MGAWKPSRVDETIKEYLRVCREEKDLSDGTVGKYRNALKRFQRYAAGSRDPYIRDLPTNIFRKYMTHTFSDVSARTWNVQLSIIRTFVNWCYADGRLDSTQPHLSYLGKHRGEAVHTKMFVREDQLPLIRAKGAEWHIRDSYFLGALWYSMRRGGELTACRVSDVDLTVYPDSPFGRLYYTNVKGRKSRKALDMSPKLREILIEWLEVYQELVGSELEVDWYLFPRLRPSGRPCGGRRRLLVAFPDKRIAAPGVIAKKALRAAGLWVEGTACHGFRRGGADDLHDKVAKAGHPNPLRIVKTMLDHESEKTTEVYLDKDRDRADLARVLADVYGVKEKDAQETVESLPERPRLRVVR